MKKFHISTWYLLPCLALLIGMMIFPLVFSATLSLSYWDMTTGTWFFNFGANYLRVFLDQRYWWDLLRTFFFILGSVVIEFSLGLVLALILSTGLRGEKIVRTILFIPFIICPVAVGYMFRMIFIHTGPLNHILGFLGIEPVPWMSSTRFSLLSAMIVDIWQYTPFCMMVLLAGLQSLPVEPYEAARVDGASRWQVFKYITLPSLRPVIAAVILIRTVDSLKVFDVVYPLTGGGPGSSSEVISLYLYNIGFRFLDFGYASSGSYILLIITIIIATQLIKRLGRS